LNKKSANTRSCLQPAPKVLVSCRGLNGEKQRACGSLTAGIAAYDPPMVMVGIVSSTIILSYDQRERCCFVVNLAGKECQEMLTILGSHSKRDGDKLAAIDVRMADGVKDERTDSAGLPGEHRVHDSRFHPNRFMKCLSAKSEYVHADAQITDDEGNIDFSRIDFIGF
jgi:hypothetical protein